MTIATHQTKPQAAARAHCYATYAFKEVFALHHVLCNAELRRLCHRANKQRPQRMRWTSQHNRWSAQQGTQSPHATTTNTTPPQGTQLFGIVVAQTMHAAILARGYVAIADIYVCSQAHTGQQNSCAYAKRVVPAAASLTGSATVSPSAAMGDRSAVRAARIPSSAAAVPKGLICAMVAACLITRHAASSRESDGSG